MMKSYLLSIVVPVYNVEKHLSLCIESILKQTFTDFELILIDDGSYDNSGCICEHYSLIDSRIKVIRKENEGVSEARNIGIKNAIGKYICFIDSDDWVEPGYLEALLKGVCYKPDMVISGLIKEESDGNVFLSMPEGVYRGQEVGNFFFKAHLFVHGGPVCKLFRMDIIRENSLSFPKGVHFGEDTLFFLDYFYYVETCVSVDNNYYHYVIEANPLSLSKKIHPTMMLVNFSYLNYQKVRKISMKHNIDGKNCLYREKCLFYNHISAFLVHALLNQYRLKQSRKDRCGNLNYVANAFKNSDLKFRFLSIKMFFLLKIIYFPVNWADGFYRFLFFIRKRNICK